MADGWIKLYRGLLDWEFFKDPKTLSVWIYLLLSADFAGDEIGTCKTSISEIAKRCGLSRDEVRSRLEKLSEVGQIEVKATGKATSKPTGNQYVKTLSISASNWVLYQSKPQANPQANPQASIHYIKESSFDTLKRVSKKKSEKKPGSAALAAPPRQRTDDWDE